MEILSFILILALLILLAKILGELSEKVGLPSLVGEVIAGIILGPSLLNLFSPSDIFHSFAEIGIIMLIFIAGFEHGSIKELLLYRKTSIIISLLSSTLPIILIVLFSYYLGFSLITSLFLAVALGATSMGVSLRSLIGVNEIDSKAGKTLIGTLVLNDVTGLILLTGAVGYAQVMMGDGQNILFEIGKVLLSVVAFFIIFYLGFMYLPKMTTFFMKFRVEEAQFSLAIIVVLFAAWAAGSFGLSSIVGAFFAGIILSRSPVFENHTFVAKISSLSYGFFIPIFFAFTGSLLSFEHFEVNIIRALLFLLVAVILQAGHAFIVAKCSKYSTKESLLLSCGMIPYGEVTLVVMSSLVALVKLKPEYFVGQDTTGLYSSILLLIMMSIFLTPLSMRLISYYYRNEKPILATIEKVTSSTTNKKKVIKRKKKRQQ